MKKHKDDDFTEVQPYMKGKVLSKTRMSFRVRCEMVNDVRGNFKSKYIRNGGEAALLCDNCDQQQIETQSHCLACPKWKGIRQGLDVIDNILSTAADGESKREDWLTRSRAARFLFPAGDCLSLPNYDYPVIISMR